MARDLPPTFADITVPLTHSALSRSAAITFGVATNEGTTAQQAASAVQTAVSNYLNGLVDSEVTIGPTLARRTPDDGGEPVVGIALTTSTGGRSGESQVPNVALLVHKVTNIGGRRGRGRMFIPWALAESEVSDVGVLTGAAQTKVTNASAAFIAALAASNVAMVLLHDENLPGSTFPSQVVQLRTDPRVGTQRRRMGR